MITLRKSSIWIAVGAVVVTLGGLALLVWGWQGASPRPSASPTALPGPSDLPPIQAVDTATSAPPTVFVATLVPGAAPSQTPTFVPPPPTELTAAGVTPTSAPEITVVAVTQSGPGASKSFDLPEGLYRVTFRAEAGFEMVAPVVEQGDCGSEPLFDGRPGAYKGSATYESSGCRVHFEVDGAGGGWSLNVDTVSDAAPQSLPLTLTGDTPLASGVVDLPTGRYVVAVDSQGSTLVVTPLVVSGECLERPILVATAPGSYKTTYESAGCRIIFQVSMTDGPWTLSVTAKP